MTVQQHIYHRPTHASLDDPSAAAFYTIGGHHEEGWTVKLFYDDVSTIPTAGRSGVRFQTSHTRATSWTDDRVCFCVLLEVADGSRTWA
eukprot:scaffold154787_cov29-Tisochrysis_lutea.AAC.2